MLNKKIKKKGQVGETVTWFIATIVIVLVLTFFTFGASYLASAKSVLDYSEAVFSEIKYKGDDIFLKKSIYSELTAGPQGAYDIKQYIKTRASEDGFLIMANVTQKEIRENFNKR